VFLFTSVVYFQYCIKELFLSYQPEGEAGSAGEQPVSNKVDAITIKRELVVKSISSFLPFIG